MSDRQHFITLSPQAKAIIANMRNQPKAMAAGCKAMDFQNQLTIGHIQRNYLSSRGPNTLGVVTNRLRSSIHASAARAVNASIQSGVGSNVVYAASHELGFDGMVSVKSFARKNSQKDLFRFGQTYSFGGVVTQDITRAQALRFGLLTERQAGKAAVASGKYKFSKVGKVQVASGMPIHVRAHQRHMKVKARHYVANGIGDRLPKYGSAISQAIMSTWKGGVA
jgi:hypothetical protein